MMLIRSSHPNFLRLTALVSEAVLEVVFVSSLGYIAARRGKFNGEAQKTVANLNIYFFTPCLSMPPFSKGYTRQGSTNIIQSSRS